ncbi:MAG: hypothetical protein CMC95_04510 [Flavobacteriales bacterium]|nr:hypothetical protein [Flavobacteriales bacterium]|tara:strand:+ start:415 stop:624 length:210 start_codon:yes stop_codon:yes gene_type:complete
MECTHEDRYTYVYDYEYDYSGNLIQILDSVKSPHIEICKDNFESKKDYEDYVDFMEDEYDYDCVNDFGN